MVHLLENKRQKSRFAKRLGYLERDYTVQFKCQAFRKGGWPSNEGTLFHKLQRMNGGAHSTPKVITS
jgi:hypothetical protein